MSLTPKQEIFVGRLVEGYSQREAYKFAYNCEKWKDNSVDSEASKLFKQPKILQRYEELKNELKEKAFYTVEKANMDLEWIKAKAREDIEYRGLKQANSSAYLNATKQQIELNGLDSIDMNKDETVKIQIVKASERQCKK
ncbi:MAG: hypothetical protein ACRCX8_13885 [Sarcina sp.]